MSATYTNEKEELNIKILLEAIYSKWGYDFRGYSSASMKRRLFYFVRQKDNPSIEDLPYYITRDKELFARFIDEITTNVTEMFRDPGFYASLRERVINPLYSYPHLKIWHAGCATGEEAYSMNILLDEEGLRQRAMIYATDINRVVLEKAKKGIYPVQCLREYSENYINAGGKKSLSSYYCEAYDHFIMTQSIMDNIVFTEHDLATDYVFGEMQIVMCRNVLIYFNRALQNKVFKLFHECLDLGGFLCLGTKETLDFYEGRDDFKEIDDEYKIYQLVR